jgi:hypothetical protein
VISVIGEELTAIFMRRGELTAAIVVDEATPEDSPLHGQFTWDDLEAAHQHRLAQARQLIRSVKIHVVEGDVKSERVRAWIHVPAPSEPAPEPGEPDKIDSGYLPVTSIGTDPRLRTVALGTMEREWRVFRRRWQQYREFWQMLDEEVASGTDRHGVAG